MARLRSRVLVAWAALVLTSACAGAEPGPPAGDRASPSDAGFPVTVADDDGVRVTIPRPPRRIVTFAPSNTEIVFALGLGDRVVGVSGRYDDHPPEARALERVGGAGEFGVDPNVEKVVSLQPDLLLAISGGGHWKERLRELDVPVFTVNATDFEDLLHDIGTIGAITGASDRAAELTESMRLRAEEIGEAVGADRATACFFEAYYPPLTTVGPSTFLFDLLTRAGCDPVSRGAKTDYPQWSVDRLVQQDPEVYLVSSESGASLEALAKRPGFRAIAAVRAGRVALIDSDLVSRPGPRVVEGLAALARALHPNVALP